MTMKRNPFKRVLSLMGIAILVLATFSACSDDEDVTPILLEDGFYIKGALTPWTDLDSKGLMVAGINEEGQAPRAGMYEKYVTLKAGATGFNIYQVAGKEITAWGPATIEDYSPAGADYQINITIKKGTLGKTGVFTVPADGLYHVTIDTETGTFGLAPVSYALCGDPNQWGDTQLEMVGDFSLNELTYKAENITIKGGNKFKLRYGKGWKYNLFETSVKVNTNLGGEVTGTLPNLSLTMAAGGSDYVMPNANGGIYTLTLKWSAATGFSNTLVKTGDVALTNWTGVELDIVGDGVSADNATAITDPSGWNWGRVIYPNPNAPTIDGAKYTWTWENVIFEANQGFKIRTKGGVAPAQNGANFDVGFSAVKTSASSSKVVDNSGNISVNAKGTYRVVITIDASNGDTKEVIITEVQ